MKKYISILSIAIFAAAAPAFAQTIAPSVVSDPLQFMTIDIGTSSLDVGFVIYMPNTPEANAYCGEDCHNFPESGAQTSDVWRTIIADELGDHFPGTYDFLLVSSWSSAAENNCNQPPVFLTFDQCKADPSYLGVDIPIIFSNPSAPAALAPIAMPSSTGSDALGFIGGQLSDPGTYLILLLVIGLPLTFFVAHKIRKLTPKK